MTTEMPKSKPMTPLQVSISTTCEVNMGDHGERHTTVHEYVPGETIEDLVYRVFWKLRQPYGTHNANDKITLKVMLNADGTVSGQHGRPGDSNDIIDPFTRM